MFLAFKWSLKEHHRKNMLIHSHPGKESMRASRTKHMFSMVFYKIPLRVLEGMKGLCDCVSVTFS